MHRKLQGSREQIVKILLTTPVLILVCYSFEIGVRSGVGKNCGPLRFFLQFDGSYHADGHGLVQYSDVENVYP